MSTPQRATLCLVAILLAVALAAAVFAQTRGLIGGKEKVLTPVEVLSMRVDALEAKLDAKIEAKTKALESENRKLRTDLDALRAENAAQQTQLARHESEITSPGGMIGLRRKIAQKAGWDRIPGGAYFVYYER